MGNPQQPCGQQLRCWFLSSQVVTAASLEQGEGVEVVLQLLSGPAQSNGPSAVQNLLPVARNLVIVRLRQTGTPVSSVTAMELAMVVLWRRLQSLLKTRRLPTVTQELQICLLSQLDPLQGLLALLLQLESVGATHYPALLELELLLDLEPVQLDLVGLEELELVELVLVDLELYLVDLDLDLELVELLVLPVELDLVPVELELHLVDLELVDLDLELVELLVLMVELDLVLVELELVGLELESGEVLLVELGPDLPSAVALVVELGLVVLALDLALVLVSELLALLAASWLSPTEQLSLSTNLLLLLLEQNTLLLLLPVKVN